MPPPPGASFWLMHGDRVVPRRPRRLFREQDQAITHRQLVKQVNAVPNRPVQSSEDIELILRALRWTICSDGHTEKEKYWNITTIRDSTMRAFGLNLLMGFLPTLARQQAWYSDVYDSPGLVRCAKCGQP